MREREYQSVGIVARLMSIEELRAYTGLGRNRALELGADAGARVNVGKRILFDRKKIDKYITAMSE